MKSLNYFKALADNTRIRIFNVLLENELSVNELVELLDTGQSGISRHLKILNDSGLLSCRRSGIRAFYSASQDENTRLFGKTAKALFRDEPLLAQDLRGARRIIEERRLETRHFFNTIAHKWDSLRQEIMGDFDLNTAIIENLGTGEVVADLGCGTGELLSALCGQAETIIGVDSSPNMLELSRGRFNGSADVDLRLGELEHLPLRDMEADTAIISLALHHLSNPASAVEEAGRILKKDGVLIIAEFDRHENHDFQQNYGDRWPGFSESEISGWLSINGFTLSRTSRYTVRQGLTINVYKSKKNKGEQNEH